MKDPQRPLPDAETAEESVVAVPSEAAGKEEVVDEEEDVQPLKRLAQLVEKRFHSKMPTLFDGVVVFEIDWASVTGACRALAQGGLTSPPGQCLTGAASVPQQASKSWLRGKLTSPGCRLGLLQPADEHCRQAGPPGIGDASDHEA